MKQTEIKLILFYIVFETPRETDLKAVGLLLLPCIWLTLKYNSLYDSKLTYFSENMGTTL